MDMPTSYLNLFNTNGSLSTESEDYLLSNFPILDQLKHHSRLGINRYEHTLLLLKSFHHLTHNNYSAFLRLAPRVAAEECLTQTQFDAMHSLFKSLLVSEKDTLFFFLLMITHDYGAIHGESRHFVRSGELCSQDFKKEEFSDDEIKIAKLLVGNHSYMGDLFLGEGNIEYGLFLYSELENLSSTPEKYWSMLRLLTLLDINSAGEGYLSQFRFNALSKIETISGLKELKRFWYKDRFEYLGKTTDFYNHYQEKLSPKVKQVYLQYFHNIVENLSDLELVNILNNCCLFLDLRESTKMNYFHFITFSGDKKENLLKIRRIGNSQPDIIIHNKNSGLINEIPFTVTDDGYLEFDVD